MKFSTFVLYSALALAIAGGAYWYCNYGDAFFDNVRETDHLPFLIGE